MIALCAQTANACGSAMPSDIIETADFRHSRNYQELERIRFTRSTKICPGGQNLPERSARLRRPSGVRGRFYSERRSKATGDLQRATLCFFTTPTSHPFRLTALPAPAIGPAAHRGEVAEWLKAADCKSARASVRWFESSPLHHRPDRESANRSKMDSLNSG